MVTPGNRPVIGPYVLLTDLGPSAIASRWLAVHTRENTTHVLHRFDACRDRHEERQFIESIERIARLDQPHLLPVERYFIGTTDGRPAVITPYTGDVDGLLTLERLLRSKGGRMSLDEAERTTAQLLETVSSAHGTGLRHGPIAIDEVLVDRRGSLHIELYGVRRALAGLSGTSAEFVRDEVRSVVEIAYQLVTGLRAEIPIIPAGRLLRRPSPAWDRWLTHGLDPTAGYDDPETAMYALPSAGASVEREPAQQDGRVVAARFSRSNTR